MLAERGAATTPDFLNEIQKAARQVQVTLSVQQMESSEELANLFASMQRDRAQALFVQGIGLTYAHRQRIIDLAAQYRLPTSFENRETVEAGGLMCYGANLVGMFQRAAFLVDKILKGAKPADLPVEQPTRFDLAINLRTAKVLGVTVPKALLLQATELFE